MPSVVNSVAQFVVSAILASLDGARLERTYLFVRFEAS